MPTQSMVEQVAELGQKVLQVAERNEEYLQGRSHIFALALAKVSDYPLGALIQKNEDGGVSLIHAFVVAHHDCVVDIKGLRSLAEMYKDFQVGNHVHKVTEVELLQLAISDKMSRETYLSVVEALGVAQSVFDIATSQIRLDAEMAAERSRNKMVRPAKRTAVLDPLAPPSVADLSSDMTRIDFSMLPPSQRPVQTKAASPSLEPVSASSGESPDVDAAARQRGSMVAVIREAMRRKAMFVTTGSFSGQHYDLVSTTPDGKVFLGRPGADHVFVSLEDASMHPDLLSKIAEAAKKALSQREIRVSWLDPDEDPIATTVLFGRDSIGVTGTAEVCLNAAELVVFGESHDVFNASDAFVALPYLDRWVRFGVRQALAGLECVFLEQADRGGLPFSEVFDAFGSYQPDLEKLVASAGALSVNVVPTAPRRVSAESTQGH